MIRYIIFAFILCVYIIAFQPKDASAQLFNPDTLKEAPHYTDLSQDEFYAQSTSHDAVPYGIDSLAFNLRLPQDFQVVTKASEGDRIPQSNILFESARFSGPATPYPPSYVSVDMIDMKYNISPYFWFLNNIVENAYTLQGLSDINNRSAEGLYVRAIGNNTFIVRSKVFLNGERIVMVSYAVPDTRWMAERAMQDMAVKSFKFSDPEPPKGEPLLRYNFLDMVQFEYPQSWDQVLSQTTNIENAYLRFLPGDARNKNDYSRGGIEVFIKSVSIVDTLAAEIGLIQKIMAADGWEIEGLIGTPTQKYKFNDEMHFKRVDHYTVNNTSSRKEVPAELWFAVLADSDFVYIVKMITPRRGNDLLTWARNKEVFETIAETIRP